MLAIARGLMSEPRILLLDEPSLGLAPVLVAEIFRLIERLSEQGLAILLSEQNAETTGRGTVRPAYAPLQALRYQIPRFYERMVQVTQVLGAGGLLINPTQADLQSSIAPDIARYYRGAGVEAVERIRLFKLAWDATGTQFGQRQLQYERYYAGDPVRTAATLYLKHDAAPLLARIEKALRP